MNPTNQPTPFGLSSTQQGAPMPLGPQTAPLYGGLQSDGGAAQQNQLQLGQPSQNGQGLQTLSAPDSVADAAKKQMLAKALMSASNIQSSPTSMQANLSGIIPGTYVGQGG